MNRRAGILAFAGGLLAASHAIRAATPTKTYRIGVLCPSWEDLAFFVRALRAVGYEDGRNTEFLFKRGDGQAQLNALATELAATKVDVIAASSTIEVQAAKRATTKIPIVMMYGVAPVELGLIASLARPGGNVTGTVAIPLELVAKSIEIFRETVPRLQRITVLTSLDPWAKIYLRETERVGHALGIVTNSLQIGTPADLDNAFAELTRKQPDGIMVIHGLVPYNDGIIRFAALHRIPAMYAEIAAVHRGGLMAYAPNLPVVYARAAAIVDKILQGAKPGDIPVEQPTRFALALNQKTAKEMALTIPQSVLARVDRVFE